MNTYVLSNLISLPRIHLMTFCKLVLSFCIILMISLAIFYIIQINGITNESNLILSCQQDIKELSQQNKNLEIGLFQGDLLENIELLAKELNYEKVGRISYIKILESTAIAK